jgi:hypothetical protein
MSQFRGMKIKIYNKDHSVAVQNELFRLGYKWASGDTVPLYPDTPYLFTHQGGRITHNHCSRSFAENARSYTTLEDLKKLPEPSVNQQIREEIIKATTVLNKYDIGCYSKAMTDHGRGYWIGCKLTTTLDDLLDTEFPLETPEQKELSEVEEQMRKLADRLAELKGS